MSTQSSRSVARHDDILRPAIRIKSKQPHRIALAALCRGLTVGIPPRRVRAWLRSRVAPCSDLVASSAVWHSLVTEARQKVSSTSSPAGRLELATAQARRLITHLLSPAPSSVSAGRVQTARLVVAVMGVRWLQLAADRGWDALRVGAAELAVDLGMSRATVQSGLKTAEQLGWIVVVRARKGGASDFRLKRVSQVQQALSWSQYDTIEELGEAFAGGTHPRDLQPDLSLAVQLLAAAAHPAWSYQPKGGTRKLPAAGSSDGTRELGDFSLSGIESEVLERSASAEGGCEAEPAQLELAEMEGGRESGGSDGVRSQTNLREAGGTELENPGTRKLSDDGRGARGTRKLPGSEAGAQGTRKLEDRSDLNDARLHSVGPDSGEALATAATARADRSAPGHAGHASEQAPQDGAAPMTSSSGTRELLVPAQGTRKLSDDGPSTQGTRKLTNAEGRSAGTRKPTNRGRVALSGRTWLVALADACGIDPADRYGIAPRTVATHRKLLAEIGVGTPGGLTARLDAYARATGADQLAREARVRRAKERAAEAERYEAARVRNQRARDEVGGLLNRCGKVPAADALPSEKNSWATRMRAGVAQLSLEGELRAAVRTSIRNRMTRAGYPAAVAHSASEGIVPTALTPLLMEAGPIPSADGAREERVAWAGRVHELVSARRLNDAALQEVRDEIRLGLKRAGHDKTTAMQVSVAITGSAA